jgi:hypothetical protein
MVTVAGEAKTFYSNNPKALLICDECIQLCVDMLFERGIEIFSARAASRKQNCDQGAHTRSPEESV